MHQNKPGSKLSVRHILIMNLGHGENCEGCGLPAVWVVLLVWNLAMKIAPRFHMSHAQIIRSCHAPCSTVMELQMQFCRNSTVRLISWLSCPISGDVAFLFGAVECHFELLNLACSVNGVFCTTRVATWTHDIFHLVRFSAGFPIHFDRERKDVTWRW
jgi:hypothetical protein